MRKIFIATTFAVVATPASAQQPLPAEANVRGALERIARIDPQIGSVIAVDPTAIDQARRVDAGNLRGPLAGQPVLIAANNKAEGSAPLTCVKLAAQIAAACERLRGAQKENAAQSA